MRMNIHVPSYIFCGRRTQSLFIVQLGRQSELNMFSTLLSYIVFILRDKKKIICLRLNFTAVNVYVMSYYEKKKKKKSFLFCTILDANLLATPIL
jgi:hypothetical protein